MYKIKVLVFIFLVNFSINAVASEDEFWKWFQSHKNEIENFSSGNEKILESIRDNLHKYNDRLYFEFSNKTDPKEFIITAEGDREQFESVFKLVNAAPKIEGWKIIALKPPKSFQSLKIEGVVYDVNKIWFLPLKSKKNPKALGLRFGIPNLTEKDKANSVKAAIILLDSTIGEFAAVTKIHYLDTIVLPENPASKGFIKMTELTSFLEKQEKSRQ